MTISNSNGKSGFVTRDYAHAAKTFLAEPGYVMAPKLGFLFHVVISFNDQASTTLGVEKNIISALAKRIDLPKYSVTVETLNKYNWRERVQTKLTYDPINIAFHDDSKNVIRNLWLAYNSYYYADPSNSEMTSWEDSLAVEIGKRKNRYGLDNKQSKRFINSIDIYSMSNQIYTLYRLVNPMITKFNLDNYDYSEASKVMESTITVEYESVIYKQGSTTDIPNFGKNSSFYDNDPSRLGLADINAITNQVPNNSPDELINRQPNNKTSQNEAYPQIRLNQATVSLSQFNAAKAVAATSLTGSQRFSFPTAREIENMSALVDIDAKGRNTNAGRIKSSGIVVSNGSTITSNPPSSNGIFDASSNNASSLLIIAKIPDGLTPAERNAFNNAFPPLPTTDARTRLPPYV